MLLASLARVGRIFGTMAGRGPRSPAKDARHVPPIWQGDEDLGETIVRSDTRGAALAWQPGTVRPHLDTTSSGDGLQLERKNLTTSDAAGVSGPMIGSPSSSPKRKRRRAKANAIDELFNGIA